MDYTFDRQSFYKMNSEEMFDKLLEVCDGLKLLDITKNDLKNLVFEIQLGRSGINFYEYLKTLNKKRESEFMRKIYDEELMFKEMLEHEKELWIRAFETNKEDARAFEEYYLSGLDVALKRPFQSYDWNRLRREYFAFKKEYFKTHTIKDKSDIVTEDDVRSWHIKTFGEDIKRKKNENTN